MKTKVLLESEKGPVILWGTCIRREEGLDAQEATGRESTDAALEEVKAAVWKLLGQKVHEVTLIALFVTDWNRDFSLWKSDRLEPSFEGGAPDTLQELLREVVPGIRHCYGENRKLYLMGYSLAGAFALWSLCQTNVFDGAASVSGSLWYPDFISRLKDRPGQGLPEGRKIYISLGGKEANTSNVLMASVEECTAEAAALLQKGNQVKYERTPGGHFAKEGKRLAKAVQWLIMT